MGLRGGSGSGVSEAELQAAIDALKDGTPEAFDTLNELFSGKAAQSDVDQLYANDAAHDAILTGIQSTVSDHDNAIVAIDGRLAEVESGVSDHATAIADHESRVANTESSIATHTAEIAAMDARLVAVETGLTATQATITDLQTRINIKREWYALTPDIITNKQFLLDNVPDGQGHVNVYVRGHGLQFPGLDFSLINGNSIDWNNSEGMDSLGLVAGDYVYVEYEV